MCIYIYVWGGGGVGPKWHVLAHPIRTQGPLEELSMTHKEEVNSKPYHNEPNPKVEMTDQRDDQPRRSLGGWLNANQ